MLAIATPSEAIAGVDRAAPAPRATLLPQGVVFQAQCRSAVALVNERRIEFVPARNQSTATKKTLESSSSSTADAAKKTAPTLVAPEAIERLLRWKGARKIGPGFSNLGNTCYLNSTLQCLAYTPCLAQYLLTKDVARVFGASSSKPQQQQHPTFQFPHKKQQQHDAMRQGFCSVRALAKLLSNVHSPQLAGARHVLQPRDFVMNVRHLSKHFRIGRQEDAHEFFRLLLDAMQRTCLRQARIAKETDPAALTTFVHRVFGGKLRNTLQCAKCQFVSERMDDFLDLSLEIDQGISSLHEALRHFTATETLDAHNAWTCSRCQQPSRAKKGMTIELCPNVLVVQFKRFDGLYGKIKKHIAFPTSMDLQKCGLSKASPDRRNARSQYELHAVLVHAGHSTNCGHYYAFVQGSSGQWYEMNDECVRWVSRETVLQQRAYMLFYSRVATAKEEEPAPAAISKAVVNGSKAAATANGTTAQSNGKPAEATVPTQPTHKLEGPAPTKTQLAAKPELTMNAFLTSLRAEAGETNKDRALSASKQQQHKHKKQALVTFHVQPAPRSKSIPINAVRVPMFVGKVGRFARFRVGWVASPPLSMSTETSELEDSQTKAVAASPSAPAPAPTTSTPAASQGPINPRTLRQVGAKNSAMYGKQIAQWADDDHSGETTSNDAATDRNVNGDAPANGSLDARLAEQHDAVLQQMRKEDWAQRRAQRKSSWDEGLDAGRVKKVRKRAEFVANEGAANAFQRAWQHKKQRK